MKTTKHSLMNFRKLFAIAAFMGSTTIVSAQEGVSIKSTLAPPHPSAMLDIESANKGLLIPRVSLTGITDATTVPSPAPGLMVYNLTNNTTVSNGFYYHDGTTWRKLIAQDAGSSGGGSVPVGGIIMWSGTVAPTGWALCDGTNGTPSLSGQFIVGYSSGVVDYNTIGKTGGIPTVTLDPTQMPSHNHQGTGTIGGTISLSGTTASGGAHTHMSKGSDVVQHDASTSIDVPRLDDSGTPYALTPSDGAHTHDLTGTYNITGGAPTITLQSAGGGLPFENRPPYYVLAYIMRMQ